MKRVLVVDDERKMRRLLQMLLETLGLESVAADTAEEALALAQAEHFDLVMTDLRLPGMSGKWTAGMVTESDGRAEPFVAVPALARAARRAGAIIVEGCAARTLDIEAGRIAGVVTEAGRVRCAQVVLAGGAWSSGFAANAGVDLPQLMVRSTVARTEVAPQAYNANISQPGLSLRRRADGGYSLATGDVAEHYLSPASFRYFTKFLKLLSISARDVRLRLAAPKGFPGAWGTPSRWSGGEISPFERMRVLNPAPSPAIVRRIEQRLGQRYPALKGVKLAEAWAGMIDVTPDAVPVLGEVKQISGLHLATGLSGHGFGLGPMVGRVVSELIADGGSPFDLRDFRFGRFSDGSRLAPRRPTACSFRTCSTRRTPSAGTPGCRARSVPRRVCTRGRCARSRPPSRKRGSRTTSSASTSPRPRCSSRCRRVGCGSSTVSRR